MSKNELTVREAGRNLSELDPEMWAEVGPIFGCIEANAVADLLDAAGCATHAVLLLTAHYVELSEHDSTHGTNGVRDGRIQPDVYVN